MELGKASEASDLVIHIVNEIVAHDYLEDDVWECLNSLKPNQLMDSSLRNHFVLTAEIDDKVVGTIEIWNNDHISLFYVEKEYRERGIGRELMRRALEICVKNNPNISEITVNSLPGTVYIYERLGFHPESPEWVQGDMSYTPMFLDVSEMNTMQPVQNGFHH